MNKGLSVGNENAETRATQSGGAATEPRSADRESVAEGRRDCFGKPWGLSERQ